MLKFRIAFYNVENLFSRPRLFSPGDDAGAAAALKAASQLQRMLDARTYKTDDIVRIYNEARLGDYLVVQCDRVNAADARSQRFFFHEREGDESSPVVSLNAAIRGRSDWIGGIRMKGETLSGAQVQAIAKVIRRVDADVIGLCEIENRHVLERFNLQYLGGKYPYAVLLEGNDERGIDVGLLSKQPVGTLRTNVFTADPAERKRRDGGSARLFNRDCLEVAVELPGGRGDVTVGVTHFKSKGGGEIETDGKRLRQASEVARIVSQRHSRDGRPHRIAILGDLNERPDRDGANGAMLEGHKTSIDPLLVHAGLSDVIGQTLGPDKAYTHIEQRRGEIARAQIDYILLSPDLRAAAANCGIDRSGQAFWSPKAPPRALAASDHACLFVDLDLERLV